MADEQLLVRVGTTPGTQLAVDREMVLGRAAPDVAGRLGDDPALSRRHARLYRGDGGELTIEDLGSSNGTFVNGMPVAGARVLRIGDVVRLGATEMAVTNAAGQVSVTTQISEPDVTRVSEPDELVVVEGLADGLRLTLEDELVLGRAAQGDERLGDDPELSRRHARIFRDGGQVVVEDMGSANGTFVNGERLSAPRAIVPGDRVRVGRTTLQLHGDTAAATPAQPAAPQAPAPSPSPAVPLPAARPTPPAAPASDALPVGSVFAGCRVEEVIGFGDMGVVHRAEELALGRRVALKVIRPEHAAEVRFRERFRRESMSAASIDHPNVIPILDAGEEDGVPYITMRLVEGTDLQALLAGSGALDPGRAARIIRQVAAALDAAHARGLVHRDIKPANVLLARGDHVYLSDFGLAKRSEEAGGLTRQGSIVARAEYVAPEQIREDRVDALSDVYTLGCLLYEALTGEAPYVRSGQGNVLFAHMDAPPPSPSEIRPDLPPGFDEVVHRAMAKDPAQRFPSAGDLGEAALVAGGAQRRASPESVVATGPAAPQAAMPGLSRAFEPEHDEAGDAAGTGNETARWVLAIGVLAVLLVGMVLALNGLNTL